MDIMAKINEFVEKIKGDPDLAAKFKANPVGTIEDLLGVDLPDEQVKQIVEGIKAKVSLDKLGDALGGLLGKK